VRHERSRNSRGPAPAGIAERFEREISGVLHPAELVINNRHMIESERSPYERSPHEASTVPPLTPVSIREAMASYDSQIRSAVQVLRAAARDASTAFSDLTRTLGVRLEAHSSDGSAPLPAGSANRSELERELHQIAFQFRVIEAASVAAREAHETERVHRRRMSAAE
jgi:hypothetical protein